jgi:adenine phosphoribosyltransferase
MLSDAKQVAIVERMSDDTKTVDLENTLTALIPACEFKGVKFCDISPLLADADALASACYAIADRFRKERIDTVAGLEARGFIFGPLIAISLGVGFVQLRKPGKLPGETLSQSYAKEYGIDTIEVQKAAIKPGQRVLLVDDILATGGTLTAACQLVASAGGTPVGCALIAELIGLGGRELVTAQAGIETLISLVQLSL